LIDRKDILKFEHAEIVALCVREQLIWLF